VEAGTSKCIYRVKGIHVLNVAHHDYIWLTQLTFVCLWFNLETVRLPGDFFLSPHHLNFKLFSLFAPTFPHLFEMQSHSHSTSTPYTLVSQFNAAINSCNTALVNAIENGGNLKEVMDLNKPIIVSHLYLFIIFVIITFQANIFATQKAKVFDANTLNPPTFLFKFCAHYFNAVTNRIPIDEEFRRGMEQALSLHKSALSASHQDEPSGRQTQASTPSQHRVMSIAGPSRDLTVVPKSPNLVTGLDNLRLSGDEDAKRKRDSVSNRKPSDVPKIRDNTKRPRDTSKTSRPEPKTNVAVPSTSMAVGSTSAPPNESKRRKVHVGTGRYYTHKCDWCKKNDVPCEIRRSIVKPKARIKPACLACAKGKRQCNAVAGPDDEADETDWSVGKDKKGPIGKAGDDTAFVKKQATEVNEPAKKKRKVRAAPKTPEFINERSDIEMKEFGHPEDAADELSDTAPMFQRIGPPKGRKPFVLLDKVSRTSGTEVTPPSLHVPIVNSLQNNVQAPAGHAAPKPILKTGSKPESGASTETTMLAHNARPSSLSMIPKLDRQGKSNFLKMSACNNTSIVHFVQAHPANIAGPSTRTPDLKEGSEKAVVIRFDYGDSNKIFVHLI